MPIRHSSEGKLNRGLSVIDSYMLLREGTEVDDEDFYLACVLGWCVEWVSAKRKIRGYSATKCWCIASV